MHSSRAALNNLESSLISTFTVKEWTPIQHQAYTIVRHYADNFKENNKKYEIKDDRNIIRNNLKDQLWFTYSKSKPIISHLLDEMTVINYICDDNEFCLNFILVIAFDKFRLHACLYRNKVNNFLNYYIFFENKDKHKAYLTYYTYAMGTASTDNIKKLKLPEFDKIYSITGINPQIFYQYELLNLFSEIIMYYDESGTLGNVPISHGLPVTLNQLIHKFNEFINYKNTEANYS